jgi:predicted dehydrogenase/threonine dehydrogenase-like Zn-dependent dehydrogenase
VKQVLIQRGQAMLNEVPAPMCEPGTVVVQVLFSCVSIGTELSGIQASGTPLWKQALRNPQKLKKAVELIAREGVGHFRNFLQAKQSAGQPAGYSAAGIVREVGPDVDDLRPGDSVACAGSQCAHHAEFIRVPRNLAVAVPDGVELSAASSVALGAIALQGIRRAAPTLGETFVVLGLGLLGQLTVQLLKANGCTVVGADLDPDRIRLAQNSGMDVGLFPDDGDSIAQVLRRTDGHGADGVIITAATPSDAVVSTAFQMCRRKGRVVLVGDVGLHLNRTDFYAKELDFFISSSYGPGRYDNRYEEGGLDYPIGHVRWTENRNMAQYLRLLAEGKVQLGKLISATFPIAQAEQAYALLRQDQPARPLMVLLRYPEIYATPQTAVTVNPSSRAARPGRIRVAVVGAGQFAQTMHIPNLQSLADRFHVRAVVNRTGHHAAAVAKRIGAEYAATDFQKVLDDPDIDAMLIATRHHLHSEMVLASLRAGKHVLVEKPMALDVEQLSAIEEFFASTDSESPPVLLTGFNRRFSPCARRLKELTARRSNPMMLTYRFNAGYLPPDHWVHGDEGGGRNCGEACHAYDLFTFLIGRPVVQASVHALAPTTDHYRHDDNFIATFHFADGSVASLTYTALGCGDFPKERLEVFCDGKVILLDDYRSLQVFGATARGVQTRRTEKGHREELLAFADVIQQAGAWPISLAEQVQATAMALTVESALRSGQIIPCG